MKVCVTGLGCISAIGTNVEGQLRSLRKGTDGLGRVTLFPTRHDVPVAEVKCTNDYLKEQLGFTRSEALSRTALLGISAAREAFLDAGGEKLKPLRIGLVSATSNGGMDLTESFYPSFHQDARTGRLREVASHDAGDSTERIASYLGLTGFRTTVSTACSSAGNAILLGARLIRQEMLDVVIAGGADALCRFTLNGFASLMILDKEPCRPFDESRAGLNLGEGAAFLVLQSEKTLQKQPYACLAGAANANDAFHQTASSPEGTGACLSMKGAIEQAGLQPCDIDSINAHGTATPNNDLSESMALREVFGSEIPPFASTKAFTGHTLGASGGIEAVYSILSIQEGLLYPNLRFVTPMKETEWIPVTKLKENQTIHSVLSNSFGFGGNHTSLLFQSYES